MATWGQQITDTANDGYVNSAGSWYPSMSLVTIAAGMVGLFRFTGLPLMRGGRVLSATFTPVNRSGSAAYAAAFEARGVLTGDVGALGASTAALPRTAASASSPSGMLGQPRPVDATDIIREIVSQPTWEAGNAVAFAVTVTSGEADLYDQSAGSSLAATLTIEYENSPQGTLTATLPALVLQLEGQEVRDVDASLDATFPALQAWLTARPVVPARLDGTLPRLGLSLTDAPQAKGTLAATLPALRARFDAKPIVAPPPPWQEVRASAAFQAAVTAHARRGLGWVAHLITPTGEDAGPLPILDGSASCDGTVGEQWAGSLTLGQAQQWVPRTVEDPLHPLSGYTVQLYWTIDVAGTPARIPCGRYEPALGDVRHTRDGLHLPVALRDVIAAVRRNTWGPGEVLHLGGMTVTEALLTVLRDRAPHLPVRIPHTDARLPDLYEVGEPGRDPLEDVLTIADAAGWRVHTDREGVIVASPKVGLGPDGPTALVAVAGREDSRMVAVTRTVNTDNVYNKFSVVASHPDLEVPEGADRPAATVQDDDPTSPLWVGRIGARAAEPVDLDTATTVEQCRTHALALLAGARASVESVDLEHRARPDLDPGAVVEVADPDGTGAAGSYHLASWDVAFAPGSLARKVLHPRRLPL